MDDVLSVARVVRFLSGLPLAAVAHRSMIDRRRITTAERGRLRLTPDELGRLARLYRVDGIAGAPGILATEAPSPVELVGLLAGQAFLRRSA